MEITSYRRGGRFTSSNIYKLIPYGKVKMSQQELSEFKKLNPKSRVTTRDGGFSSLGLTYIQEKQIEKRLESSIDLGGYSRPMAWGIFMEIIVLSELHQTDLGYRLSSKSTEIHPDLELGEIWSGSNDFDYYREGSLESIAETKSYQKKAFALYTDCLIKQSVPLLKREFPQEYWQIISNAIINEVDYGEAISYMPYESQYELIKDRAENAGDFFLNAWKYRFIYEEPMHKLPFLKDDGYYKNLNRFRFEIPKEDKILLTNRVIEAGALLNK